MRTLVLTGYDEQFARVGRRTTPCKHAWAVRHGYDFVCVRDFEPGSHPSWQKLRLLSETLANYQRVVWLDADAVITNPLISAETLAAGSIAPVIVSTDVFPSAREHGIRHYFSCGNAIWNQSDETFAILKAASQKTEWMNKHLWDQGALWQVAMDRDGAGFDIRPRRLLCAVPWECHADAAEPWERGDFLAHFTSTDNNTRASLSGRYLLEAVRSMAPKVPTSYDVYQSIDLRHAAWIYETLVLSEARSAIEVGCYDGVSSAAFLQALRAGHLQNATFCDLEFRASFLEIAAGAPGATLFKGDSGALLRGHPPVDFVLLDGDHRWCGLEIEWCALEKNPPRIIAAHDICATICGYGGCAGPSWLWHQLQDAGWHICVDARRRHLERTERGMLLATPDAATAAQIRRAWQMTCLP